MAEPDWLAEQFEARRTHLRAVAYRMLGSRNEADDAVQEAWLRLSRSDPDRIENLAGWLTTVVARVCLSMLQSRRLRHEEPVGGQLPEAAAPDRAGATDPEEQALLADSVGLAMLVVLDTLRPPERVAFVLHDMFLVPFDEIGSILGRTPTAARQLASRARRRVQGAAPAPDQARQRRLVEAFLAASRNGDFQALLAVLDPEVVLRVDQVAQQWAAAAAEAGVAPLAPEVRGAGAVAGIVAGRAQGVQVALVNGAVAAVWAPHGRPRVVFRYTIADDRIVAIEMTADPDRIARFAVSID